MPYLIIYIFKLTIGLALVYLFYRLALRKLTFYSWNRWYLLAYSFLCFFMPFIDITPVLGTNRLESSGVMTFIPLIENYTVDSRQATLHPAVAAWDRWDWIILVFASGTGLFLLRFLTRYLSLWKMRRNAQLLLKGATNIYQVDKAVIPFSFGNSIFVNRRLHTEQELREIIRHELVHVKQRHTWDIIWSELLCMLNWYNPFTWLIRQAIRQNLEFMADQQVVGNGLDKKQYQYLLLKVIGNRHFSIANQFNFSSLKKRIAMMNKTKSARVHLFKFLFLIPLLAVLLLAFRNNENKRPATGEQELPPAFLFKDTVPGAFLNSKGYHVVIEESDGAAIVVVRDRNRKEIERLSLEKWNKDKAYYVGLYGDIVPPPPPPPPPVAPLPPVPPTGPLSPSAPAAPLPPSPPVPAVSVTGRPVPVNVQIGSTVAANVDVSVSTVVPVATFVANTVSIPGEKTFVAAKTASNSHTQNTAMAVTVADDGLGSGRSAVRASIEPGKKILEIRIPRSATRERLNQFIAEARSSGVDLEFDRVKYNNANELTSLSGKLQKEGSKSMFSINGFDEITLLVMQNDTGYSCMVYSQQQEGLQ